MVHRKAVKAWRGTPVSKRRQAEVSHWFCWVYISPKTPGTSNAQWKTLWASRLASLYSPSRIQSGKWVILSEDSQRGDTNRSSELGTEETWGYCSSSPFLPSGQPWPRARVPTSLNDCILLLAPQASVCGWLPCCFRWGVSPFLRDFHEFCYHLCVWFLFCLFGFWW